MQNTFGNIIAILTVLVVLGAVVSILLNHSRASRRSKRLMEENRDIRREED